MCSQSVQVSHPSQYCQSLAAQWLTRNSQSVCDCSISIHLFRPLTLSKDAVQCLWNMRTHHYSCLYMASTPGRRVVIMQHTFSSKQTHVALHSGLYKLLYCTSLHGQKTQRKQTANYRSSSVLVIHRLCFVFETYTTLLYLQYVGVSLSYLNCRALATHTHIFTWYSFVQRFCKKGFG